MDWTKIGTPVRLQLSYLLLAVLWNLAGLALIAQGMRAPGPTASGGIAAYLLALALVIFIAARRLSWLYGLASLLVGLGAASAVVQAFQLDPSLWPSAFWRYAGILLNGFGVLASVWGGRAALIRRRLPAGASLQ